ncbi:hypothetical protein C8R45DRAFT_1222102, partial [Mycena sanguinolenta]
HLSSSYRLLACLLDLPSRVGRARVSDTTGVSCGIFSEVLCLDRTETYPLYQRFRLTSESGHLGHRIQTLVFFVGLRTLFPELRLL